jgi:hypothetical protein
MYRSTHKRTYELKKPLFLRSCCFYRTCVDLSTIEMSNAQRSWDSAIEQIRVHLPLYLHSKHTTHSHTHTYIYCIYQFTHICDLNNQQFVNSKFRLPFYSYVFSILAHFDHCATPFLSCDINFVGCGRLLGKS